MELWLAETMGRTNKAYAVTSSYVDHNSLCDGVLCGEIVASEVSQNILTNRLSNVTKNHIEDNLISYITRCGILGDLNRRADGIIIG